MKKITDAEFADFLSNKPLYYKIKAVENMTSYHPGYMDKYDYTKKAFKYLCPNERDIQTFKTDYGEKGTLSRTGVSIYEKTSMPVEFDEKTKKLDFIFHLHGVCQSCEHKIHFLVRAYSDKSWDELADGINIFIQKVGQYPSYEINLNSNLSKYLSEEDQINYKHALTSLSISYGIGAYAYFRRVIENEIKRIIKDISELEFDGVANVRDAYNKFQTDFNMSNLIEVLNTYLPFSLKELGGNPIKLLYQQLSGGIHSFSEQECQERAISIDILFNHVIKKINEEKYQLGEVKKAMNKLS